jgi:hypothetical protein
VRYWRACSVRSVSWKGGRALMDLDFESDIDRRLDPSLASIAPRNPSARESESRFCASESIKPRDNGRPTPARNYSPSRRPW